MGQVGPEKGTHSHRGHQEAGPESSHLPLEQEEETRLPPRMPTVIITRQESRRSQSPKGM